MTTLTGNVALKLAVIASMHDAPARIGLGVGNAPVGAVQLVENELKVFMRILLLISRKGLQSNRYQQTR